MTIPAPPEPSPIEIDRLPRPSRSGVLRARGIRFDAAQRRLDGERGTRMHPPHARAMLKQCAAHELRQTRTRAGGPSR